MSPITPRQVRAFRLARHHLTNPLPAERLTEVVAAVGGVQAQVMSAAELAIWARSEGLSRENVQESLWQRRELVKTWCMRGTLHLLSAADWPVWSAALAQRAQWRRPAWLRWFGLTLEEMEELIATLGAGLDAEGKTREEVAALAPAHLRESFLAGWGSHLKPAAYQGVLVFGPNRGRNVTFVNPKAWLDATEEVDREEAPRELFRRFLRAYGPATHQDFAQWWGGGIAGPARKLLRSLEDELEPVEAEGRQAWVLAGDAELLRSLDPPRSIHLLPVFDVYTLHYRPREAFLPPGVYDRIYRTAGWISPVVLVDGAVAGVWEHKKRARRLDVRVELFVRETKRLRAGIVREAKRLGEFLELPVELQL
ncbi:MAG: winged helix DNA-binding domain-containing protein [Actinobacteria bacterium]|nr:winged helix DNA-binding domain-containing protein [Actinomycetota bacterium]